MERPTGEGSASGSSLVPAVSSMMPQINAPAVNLAGLTPTPGTRLIKLSFTSPYRSIFSLHINNLMFLDESNIDRIRREAEERHTQLMEQMVQQLCSDFEARSIQMQQTCMSELLYCSSVLNQTSDMSETQQSFLVSCFRAV